MLRGGRDGNSTVGDTQYTQQAWDVTTSPFNNLEGKNLGLVKFATPGINSTAVQKAGGAYAAAKNHQYRNEIPSNITTDTGALGYINDTIGRNDYAVHHFPSYGDVPDPDPASSREGKRKTIPLTGMILGREARIAVDFQGYHKAAAGIDATLPRLLAIPTGDRKLDEESLNPAGINVIKKKNGNFVIWGDRVSALDSNWKFKHQREQMSFYEHVLAENFDFIIFTINDADSDAQAITSLIQFFQPEFVKRALRGKTFADACSIKVDAELNTDASRANGDKIAAVTLRLADTTERFIIRIGKAGIFEAVA
jgi:phage tail sheath protein FI